MHAPLPRGVGEKKPLEFKTMRSAAVAILLLAVYDAQAQDPATGWMAYAVGTVPSGTERITRLEMTWKVGMPHA